MNFKRIISEIIRYYKIILRYINLRRIEDLRRRISEINSQQCASISYFPFIGWIYPLIKRKYDSFCIFHVKQGFILFIIFVLTAATLNLINIFTPAELRYMRMGLVIVLYAINIIYFAFCLFAIRILIKGKTINIRPIKRFTDRIEL